LGEGMMKVIKIKDFREIPQKYTGIVEWDNGTKAWYLKGFPHREDGPAVEYPNGEKRWYLNGERLFFLIRGSYPFIFLEEFVDEKGKKQIKILNQKGTKIWPNLPGLKELADNADNFQSPSNP
jgi:hypothetical protein